MSDIRADLPRFAFKWYTTPASAAPKAAIPIAIPATTTAATMSTNAQQIMQHQQESARTQQIPQNTRIRSPAPPPIMPPRSAAESELLAVVLEVIAIGVLVLELELATWISTRGPQATPKPFVTRSGIESFVKWAAAIPPCEKPTLSEPKCTQVESVNNIPARNPPDAEHSDPLTGLET